MRFLRKMTVGVAKPLGKTSHLQKKHNPVMATEVLGHFGPLKA